MCGLQNLQKVFESAYIHGPAIIGKDAEVRHCAFIRGNAIVGEGAVVGNSTELRMLYCSIKYRFHITTMLEIPYLDTKHIWSRIYHFQCKIRQETGRSKIARRTD